MPELPEVETLRRQMERALKGARIRRVEVRFGGRIRPSGDALMKIATGAAFAGFGRRAKLLLLHLSNGWTIVTHLKMTGGFLLKPVTYVPGKHDHVVFLLSKVKGQRSKIDRQLVFQDVRKFGFLKVVKTADLEREIFEKEGYGPEPLDPSFTFARFRMCVTGRAKKKIKPLLMEQTCIAGIGNIYADEACWEGRVHPERTIGSLSEAELRGVYRGAILSMRDSIKRLGSSTDNYRDLYGKEGGNVPHLRAYGREGGKCRRRDGGLIRKIWINGRAAHFCPKCQK
jgi:formamidopyrimidine-DNA glycosylase